MKSKKGGKAMRIGDRLSGTISGIQSYGVFVKLDDDHQGLIHISELKHGFVSDLNSKYKVGDKVDVIVMGIDEYNQKNQFVNAGIATREDRQTNFT